MRSTLKHRVIDLILGGFAGYRPFNDVRKRGLKASNSILTLLQLRNTLPSITFSKKDNNGVNKKHDDYVGSGRYVIIKRHRWKANIYYIWNHNINILTRN